MRIDIHVHTGRYSGCAVASPQEMARAALAAGLDGIVLTEHDLAWPLPELMALRREFPLLTIFRGAEMTVAEGEHILVLGCANYDLLLPMLPYRMLLKLVRDQGGIAILAHPFRQRAPEPELLELVDGVEIVSHNIASENRERAKQLAEEYLLPALVASDAHSPQALGPFAADLAQPVASEGELALALARGNYTNYIDPTFSSLRDEFYRGWKSV